jgi:hypothetical protein
MTSSIGRVPFRQDAVMARIAINDRDAMHQGGVNGA